jgi:hypothetical protein
LHIRGRIVPERGGGREMLNLEMTFANVSWHFNLILSFKRTILLQV